MTVQAISGVQHYVGLLADDKPTDGVPAGSTFLEVTSGSPRTVRKWIYDGSEWGLAIESGDDVDSNLLVPRVLTGEAVIDESAANWTGDIDLVVVTPDAESPIRDARLDLDLAKASTGFAAGYAAQTLTLTVWRKTDGTNWRKEAAQTAISGTNSASRLFPLSLGMVGVDDEVKVTAKLSAENGGSTVAEIPYRLHYVAAVAPTVTAAE